MAFLDPVFNPVFMPLVNQAGPFWTIVILSLVVSLVSTVAYKYLTDQKLLKEIRDRQKEYQKKLKELRSNPEELKKVQSEYFQNSGETMKQSFGQSLKPMMITLIPLLLIFGWMSGHLAYEPIYPGESYSVAAVLKSESLLNETKLILDAGTEIVGIPVLIPGEKTVTWSLKSQEGEHNLTVKAGATEQTKTVLITQKLEYAEPVSAFQHSDIEQIKINYRKLQPLGSFELFGWYPGWLGLYFIFSLIFSMGLRKVLKVY